MSGPAYLASEDSALLRRALRPYSGKRCLEIGAGNGGNLLELSKRFKLTVGTDLVRPGISDWKEAGANFILADGASCMRPSAFDLVAFNPPYVPADPGDRTVDGGRNLEVPKKFLAEALGAVKDDGEVVFILNNEADMEEFLGLCSALGFGLERLMSERVFFEELNVYSAMRVSGAHAKRRTEAAR